MSHVENWVLTSLPLSVCIGHWGVLWQHAGDVPVEKVWVVCECFGVNGVVVHHNWTIVSKTTTKTSHDEQGDPTVGKEDTGVEILDWELADNEEAEEAADLCSGGVVSPVEIRSIHRSGNFLHFAFGEPASQDSELTLSFRCPGGHDFFEVMFRQTEANQLVILYILRNLWVDLSSLQIIVSVLNK